MLIPLKQGSPIWHDWRDGGLGGSDVGSIMLGDEWPFEDSRPDKLLERKIACERAEINFAMRRGQAAEDGLRAWYEAATGVQAPPACVQHDECEWMRVSLDGLTLGGVVLEIKYPNWLAHDCALAGVVPAYYYPQVQYQLLVSGCEVADYVSGSGNKRYKEEDKRAIVRVEADPEIQAEIYEKAEAFWLKVVKGRQARSKGHEVPVTHHGPQRHSCSPVRHV